MPLRFRTNQIMEIREVFDTFDSDGSGAIDVDELRAAMKVQSPPLSASASQTKLDYLPSPPLSLLLCTPTSRSSPTLQLQALGQPMTKQAAKTLIDEIDESGEVGYPPLFPHLKSVTTLTSFPRHDHPTSCSAPFC